MMKKNIAALLLAAMLLVPCQAQELLDTKTKKLNYSLGFQIGGDFKRQGVEMDAAAVVKGIEDALTGKEALMSRPEMHQMLVDLKKKVTVE